MISPFAKHVDRVRRMVNCSVARMVLPYRAYVVNAKKNLRIVFMIGSTLVSSTDPALYWFPRLPVNVCQVGLEKQKFAWVSICIIMELENYVYKRRQRSNIIPKTWYLYQDKIFKYQDKIDNRHQILFGPCCSILIRTNSLYCRYLIKSLDLVFEGLRLVSGMLLLVSFATHNKKWIYSNQWNMEFDKFSKQKFQSMIISQYVNQTVLSQVQTIRKITYRKHH